MSFSEDLTGGQRPIIAEMARWMKALAVALAAVVGLVPAFAQVSAAQSVPQSAPVLPVGDELVDDELNSIVGESFVADILWGLVWESSQGILRLGVVLLSTSRLPLDSLRLLAFWRAAGLGLGACSSSRWSAGGRRCTGARSLVDGRPRVYANDI